MESKKVRTLTGIVTKKSSNNTVKVRVERKFPHPLYKKIIKSHRSYLAHCVDMDSVNLGDAVVIAETKPISKSKHWTVAQNLSNVENK